MSCPLTPLPFELARQGQLQRALNLPELITVDLADYETKAAAPAPVRCMSGPTNVA